MNSVAKYFRFGELGTNFRTELIAGLTTFVSMAYILFVNPTVLGAAGMDKGAVFTATGVLHEISCPLPNRYRTRTWCERFLRLLCCNRDEGALANCDGWCFDCCHHLLVANILQDS